MSLDAQEITHLADLARISLTEQEKLDLTEDLNRIVEFVDQLQSEKSEGIEPSDLTIELDKARPDEVGKSLSSERLSEIAPKWESDQLVVPSVLDLKDE